MVTFGNMVSETLYKFNEINKKQKQTSIEDWEKNT